MDDFSASSNQAGKDKYRPKTRDVYLYAFTLIIIGLGILENSLENKFNLWPGASSPGVPQTALQSQPGYQPASPAPPVADYEPSQYLALSILARKPVAS